ncbi:MAG: tetratricopeptide repeat protein [Gemmatimonadales bacterium]|nr:tetratricopeptide repeat protein [Gemmatimonadales bacterium]
MRTLVLILAAAFVSSASAQVANPDVARWERQARAVTIIRDDWGIPHVYGKRDADVVFGVMYAQAEDDFNRIETNYINAMGRLAEAEGEGEIYRDLRMKLFINPDSMKARYRTSPAWLKTLMNAYADGLNYYLHTHPEVTPRVIRRFEPWMALTFSEGSIGGDIEKVSLGQLEAFYGRRPAPAEPGGFQEPSGSNGFAIAPSNSATGRALLLINPHTSFFFRAEVQMVSEEGLNAYGAVTWGQFFVYQGFNDRAGWMHTSSGVDAVDEYAETVTKREAGYTYRFGRDERPVVEERITVPYKTAGGMAKKVFTVYRTHHGPVVREAGGKWVSIRLMQEPVKALTQSYVRTRARDYAAFRRSMELHTNSSNNTIYADADGSIAYFHANFIPKRDTRFDWNRPVDGSDPATEWGALLSVEESPHLLNPAAGWLYNTNNWPYSAAGPNSPKKESYPSYVETGGENARGLHAIRVLEGKKDFTLHSLIAAAYDSYLTAFEPLIPALVKAYDERADGDSLKAQLAEHVKVLREWDLRWGVTSVPTTLAIAWAEEMGRGPSAGQHLQALAAASAKLTADFGTWKTPWGEINRFQRLTSAIVQPFNDAAPSIPVGFTSARWGSLASFGARTYPGTKKLYGTSGNSFVAVVEFGDSVRAKAITAGGLNSVPGSRHFNDQALRYSTGDLREVYFYRSQLEGHTERQYHPGDGAQGARPSVQYRSPSGIEYRAQADTGAIARAEEAVRAAPRSVERLIQLGVAQSGARQFREAIQTFTRGLAIAPNNPMLYRWRGHRYLSVRQFDRAMSDLTRGLRLDSTNYGILYHLGIVRYQRGDFSGAARAFARAQPRAPDAGELAGSTDWLWMSLMRAGRAAEAKAMLDRRPDSLPTTNAYRQRLRLYRGEIGPDQLFTPADTSDVQVATLSYGLGNWYVVRGDTAKARDWFNRSVASGGWPGFGFILSETELRRLRRGARP